MKVQVSEAVDLRIAATTIKFQDFADAISKSEVSRLNFALVWEEAAPSWLLFMDQSALAALGLEVHLKIGMINPTTSKHTINLFSFTNNSHFKKYAGIDAEIDADAKTPRNNVLSSRITLSKMSEGDNFEFGDGSNEIWFILPVYFAAYGTSMECEVQGWTEVN